jgi:lipoate-protein ligase A
VDALCTGCEQELEISLFTASLDESEVALAARLLEEKYAQPAWNRERRVGLAD